MLAVALRSTGYLGFRLETLFWQPADLLRIACQRFDYKFLPGERAFFLPGTNGPPACS